MKYTKIIATIGPASDSVKEIRRMYKAGMNVARLNFSHGDYEYFEKVIKNIRKVSSEIAIMLDTKGPQIRTTKCREGPITLHKGDKVMLTNNGGICDEKQIDVTYNKLDKLEVGNRVFFDDGLIESEVIGKKGKSIQIKILNSGVLGSNKTVSIHGHNVEIPFLGKKDMDDIMFGIRQNLSFVAASFVRSGKDVDELQAFLDKHKSHMQIISKVEHWNAVENIDEIIKKSFGVMVARGDLGVEVRLEKVPSIQWKIIKSCNRLGRPVIVATQMLESMKDNPRPTRAEVSDVAQAIMQGADAVMLSGETAAGKHPTKAVEMMARIAHEHDMKVRNYLDASLESHDGLYTNEVSLFVTRAAYLASRTLHTKAILTPTETGYTPRKVSRFKPSCPILAITRDRTVMRQLQISWGVIPIYEPMKYVNMDKYFKDLVIVGMQRGFLHKGDRVVLTAGTKQNQTGTTNLLEIHSVDEILHKEFKSKHATR